MSVSRSEIRAHKRKIYISVLKFLLILRRVNKYAKRGKSDKVRELAEKNVKLFYKLGPTFIKLGQILSSRGDMFPQEYIDKMSELQDIVPPAPFEEIKREIEEEYGRPLNDVFEYFEERPIFSASLGQVHMAKLGGKTIVVKVLRPGIRKRVELDLGALKSMRIMLKTMMGEDFYFMAQRVLSAFEKSIYDEMDYRKEANNLLEISENLYSREKDLRIPGIYMELVREKVLPMEYIPGIKITDVEKLKEKGFDLKSLASRVVEVFTTMVIKDNVFHADPHPGNIYVDENGHLILYDFGMVGRLDKKTRRNLFMLYNALISRDADRIIDAMIRLDALDPYADRYVIKKGIVLALRSLEGEKVSEYEVRELVNFANKIFYEFPFRLPDNLALFIRMYVLMEGVALTLDPEFNMLNSIGKILDSPGMRRELVVSTLSTELETIMTNYRTLMRLIPKMNDYLDMQSNYTKYEKEKGYEYIIPGSIFVGSAVLAINHPFISLIGFALSIALFIYFYLK
ncbi:MAG: AarF/UbiB family protein [Thermoplasmata archaeon]|jgi:predicted unusual protein kinase regulating ubiquinone biosynthesis (AarF/ABC1/UbiB family)|nr:AarF/ABC1/UbiB kinase family protein [Thermoplasmata archaeon]MVT14010.1 AarF/ABC1/UbiB kinase family protein [Euryarchaeota archaeon]